MSKITVYDSMTAPDTSGSSLKGYLDYGVTFDDLVKGLGEPTFLPEDSGDGKINFEWVVDFENEDGDVDTFTIYDWKVDADWSRHYTGTKEQAGEFFGGSRWHVGGKSYALDFIDFIVSKTIG